MTNIIASYKQKRWTSIFVIYLRYLIGGAFVFSSIPKILGERFLTSNCEDAPINTFPHLFETLYRSGLYWEFLGWGQLFAALLLMTQLFATIGALAFLPILLNIFVITLSYEFGGTPIIVGLMLLANVFLLVWDYNKLLVLLTPDSYKDLKIENQYSEFFNNLFWAYLGLIIFATTVVYVLMYDRNPTAWFFICVAEGLVGLIYMNRKYKKQTVELT
ncbi:MAG TPA: hypothetical protein VJY62_19865 [Bacteroidia bacterium]|nr:hypothetical protein [Bacteroidia bacterium]